MVTKSGRRPRHRCKICGGTVSLNTGTPYRGLRCGRREFDQVASLRVEGVSISATARTTGRSRNTVARWLDRASRAAARFNRHILKNFEVRELQADELYTFIGSKRRPTWLFATLEVASRVWASSLVGRRSSRNTRAVLDDVILRGRLVGVPLIATDGFESYGPVIHRLMGPACVYGQVIKTRRNDRVVRVERRVKIGSAAQLEDALVQSEDSEHLNTSFVRWTPSFGPKSGLAKVEPAGSVLVVVVSCELGCRPGPGTRNGPTPVRGDGVQVAASAPRSGVGAERRTWRRSSTPAPGAEAARALMRRGTSTSSHRTRPASDSPTTYAVARHCRSGSSARFPRAPRSANHRGAGRSPHT